MIIPALALKVLGPGAKAVAVALAAVGAVLVWGAVEDGMGRRRSTAVETATEL